MAFTHSEDMLSRPRHTIHAAELFHLQAREVARVCGNASAGQVVIAAVDEFLTFRGVRTVDLEDLRTQVAELEGRGGWTLVFSPGARLPEIQERCLELARQAFKRWEALLRWTSRHPEVRRPGHE